MSINLKSKKVAAGAIAVVLVGTGTAYAYWTAGGSGDGEAATSGGLAGLVVNQTGALTPMYPGGAPQTLSGTFDNGNTTPAYITSVTASIDSVVNAADEPILDACAADFVISGGGVMLVGADVPAGNGVGSWGGATISLTNTGANQDACKDATVNLHYVAA